MLRLYSSLFVFSMHKEQAKEADDADAVGIPEEEEESRISWGSSSSSSSCNKNEQGEMSLNEDEFPLLIKFIGFWAERLPHDFRDDRMMQFIRIISRTVSSNANISAQVILGFTITLRIIRCVINLRVFG